MIKKMNYVYEKLIGAGFAFSLFVSIVYIMIGFDLYELSQTLQNPWIWIAFYPYAIITSVIIDGLTKTRLLSTDKPRYFVLIAYQLFGFIPFLILMFPGFPLILIAGIVGVLCASIFYTGLQFISNYKIFSIIFAFIIPIVSLIVMENDFTVKKGWQEITSETSYQVNFDYFHGHHKIPFELEEKETLTFQIETNATNGGGWGYYVEAPYTKNLPMEFEETEDQTEPDKLYFTAPESGTYYIVLTGSRLRGSMSVEWSIS